MQQKPIGLYRKDRKCLLQCTLRLTLVVKDEYGALLDAPHSFSSTEGQTVEASEPSKKKYSFGNREALDTKVLPLFQLVLSMEFHYTN
jgi:hypothetical protein